ncbi:hypothetical protein [Rhodoplanes sp. Z2-YC6860]|uniref:hypothetical protein n=1 Tax=Rhodoplanes sp. Z2-YC6860 TaxID=674703 RepID=UPI0008360975|nr:hypothetical protein [Rhodoplanes sp. Z2-YC6860]
MHSLEDDEVAALLGRRVRVRNGKYSFVGTLSGPSDRKFPRGPDGTAYGCVLEGWNFRLEFAWWDWTITPVGRRTQSIAAE